MKSTSRSKKSAEVVSSNDIPEDVPADRTSNLQELFTDNIKCLYWVENHLLVALPKMVSAASNTDLQQAFAQHLEVTRGHVTRIEKIFDLLQKPPLPKKSDALEGLAMDGEHIIEETIAGSDARHTGLIMAGLLVENYEITAYKGCLKLADKLNLPEVSQLLSETLAEEEEADSTLEALANA